jgi:beta-catenin-like protein 1
MTNVDELFKKPGLSGNKRKAEVLRDADEVYKQAKLGSSSSIQHNGPATVEDVDDDAEAGPELPPDFDEGEDQDGRFFGGGVSKDTADVLDFIDEREKDGPHKIEKIDAAWVRRIALNFEKRISKNAELRAKYEGEPAKFMSSEADLDADIKSLSILSEHPELYEEFARLGCAASLVSLLAHENTDIAIDAIEVISELIDQDIEAEQAQWDAFVDAILEADLLDLLYQNLARLDEGSELDRAGVYHILEVFEALASRDTIAESIGKHSSVLGWLLSRVSRKESTVSQNKQYAAEVMAVLLQSQETNVRQFIDQDGVEVALQNLSAFRKRDPERGSEEEEYMENLFDSLASATDITEGKEKFVEAEGIELCLIMLKDGKMSRPRALRILDHALGGNSSGFCANRLVEAAGLKQLFSMLMKRQDGQSMEHILGILSSMLRTLPGDSAARIRLLGKFVEKEYEKIGRIFALRRDFDARVKVADSKISQERERLSRSDQEDLESEWLSRRLDAGLFSLQTVDVILAWLVAEDDGARNKIQQLFADRDEGLAVLKKSLQDQIDGITLDTDVNNTQRDMLSTLSSFLT